MSTVTPTTADGMASAAPGPDDEMPRGRRVAFWPAVAVVAQRELMVKLRSKAFLVSTAITLLVVIASVVLTSIGPSLFGGPTSVAVTSQTEQVVSALDDVETTVVDSDEAARDAVRDGTADAAVLGSSDASGLTVIGDRTAPDDLVQALSIAPQVELLDPNAPNPVVTYFIGFGFGLVFFMAAIMFGQAVAQSVAEEKQTRIVEILLAAVPARAMLAGKVLAASLLAFGQIALIAIAVFVSAMLTDNTFVLDGLAGPLIWFVVLFVVGFIMISALFAAAAALVSRMEDLQSTASPVMMLVMLPYFLVIFFNNNPTVLAVMSYIPFSAPVAVPMRLYIGTAAWWEPFVALAIMLATTVGILWFAARTYERSLLKTGKVIRWRDALRA